MKRLLIALSFIGACGIACAQSFPLGATFIYSPKVRHTIAAVTTPVGSVEPITVFGRTISPTAFLYVGSDLSASKAAGGIGLSLEHSNGGLTETVGLTYGTVIDETPHLGFCVGLKIKLKQAPSAKVHEYLVR
jgi:hypothetical protein